MESPPPEALASPEPSLGDAWPYDKWLATATTDELLAHIRDNRGDYRDDYVAKRARHWNTQLCYELLDHGPYRRGAYVGESVRRSGDPTPLVEAVLRHAEEWMEEEETWRHRHNPVAYFLALSYVTSGIDVGHAHRLANLANLGSVSSALLLSRATCDVGGLLQWIVQVVDRDGWSPRRCEAGIWELNAFCYYSYIHPSTAQGLIVRVAAASAHTPLHVLRDIAGRHTDRWTREALAGNARALEDPTVRAALAPSKSAAVRRALGGEG